MFKIKVFKAFRAEIFKRRLSKIRKKLKWKPQYTFESMIEEMIEYWMNKIQYFHDNINY